MEATKLQDNPSEPFRSNAHITTLPEEVISNVTLRLGKDDSQAFRLTCHSLEEKSLHVWATEYFEHKGIFILTDSLKSMVAISKSSKLRDYVHTISVIPIFLPTNPKLFDRFECSHAWDRSPRDVDQYRLYLQDQTNLLMGSGSDCASRDILVNIFSSLPRLRRLVFADCPSSLPQHADIRGFNKMMRLTGVYPSDLINAEPHDVDFWSFYHLVWRLFLIAVSVSNFKELNSFQINFQHITGGLQISQLKLAPALEKDLRAALSKVRKLAITIDPNLSHEKVISTLAKDVPLSVQSFAKVFCNVEELLLLCHDTQPTISLRDHALQLSLSVFKNFMRTINVATLSDFCFSLSYCTEVDLVGIISRLTSARFVEFFGVNVLKGSWVGVLKALSKMPSLQHLHLRYCAADGLRVYFLTQLESDSSDMDSEEDHNDAPLGEDDIHGTIASRLASKCRNHLHPIPSSHGLKASRGLREVGLQECCNDFPYIALEHQAKSGSCERGYHVCVAGEEIGKMLPRFIKEYNTEDPDNANAGLDLNAAFGSLNLGNGQLFQNIIFG